jgi:hypothetical protein
LVFSTDPQIAGSVSAESGLPGAIQYPMSVIFIALPRPNRLGYFGLRLRATFLAALGARLTSLFLATGEDLIVRSVISEYKVKIVQPSR